jgi:predicted permease
VGLALVVAAVLIATAIGVASERRWGDRADRVADRLLRLVLFGVLPIVVFFNVVGLEVSGSIAAGLGLAWVAALSTGALVYLVGRRRWSPPVVGAAVVAALASNTGYLGYPMTAIFLGPDRLAEAVAYDVVVAVPVLLTACFAVGAALGDEAGEGAAQRARAFALRNPVLPAFALALVAPEALAPDVLVVASQALIFAVLPAGFFAVGVQLASTAAGGTGAAWARAPIATAVVARLALAPSLLFLLTLPLIDVPTTFLLVAAMPAGLNTLVVANAFGLARGVAAGAIAWSTVVVLAAAAVAAAAGLI